MREPERSCFASAVGWILVCAAIGLVLGASSAWARDYGSSSVDYYSQLNCGQLWSERNGILARHGYCFKSERGIAAFGKGCRPPFGKLPDNLQRVVQGIAAWERRKGCA